jgi:competence protein ComEA
MLRQSQHGHADLMRLFILFVALALIASCQSRDSVTNSNSVATSETHSGKATEATAKLNEPCLNLNTATTDDLIKLPGVGEVIAKRIIDYRERHVRFRRPEEIIIIEGFSENKYRAIADSICVE